MLLDPLAPIAHLQERTNGRLGRDDLTSANIQAALNQIPASELRVAMKKEVEKGNACYKEEALMSQMISELADIKAKRVGITEKQASSMTISDPTAIKALIDPFSEVTRLPSTLRLLIFSLSLYYWGVPLETLGRWLAVHKTTILRHVVGLSGCLWDIIEEWLIQNVKARKVYIDEKWLKIRGKWHYWFVVLDEATNLPVLSNLLTSRTHWATKFIAIKLKALRKIPKVIITDGLAAYKKMGIGAVHILCLFHHQQSVTRFLKQHFNKGEIKKRKKLMKEVFATENKRTVLRRLEKLSKIADSLGIQQWVKETKKNLCHLITAVGSKRIPKTNNAIERFFRAFNRFYKTKCGFFSIVSARRQIVLFMVVYLFTKGKNGKAPIETIMPQVQRMPLYKIINDPFGCLFSNSDIGIAAPLTFDSLLA